MDKVLAYLKKSESNAVVIVGSGNRGRSLLAHLEKNTIAVAAFFDNDENLIGTSINGIQVMKPYKVEESMCAYIIAAAFEQFRKELYLQLQSLGIDADHIVIYDDYDYLSNLDEKYYQEEINKKYFAQFGKEMNWRSPSTYNEIINWEKLNVKDSRRTYLSDKYLVREWVKEKIGEEHLTKLYGVWDDADQIDFDILPNAFALKMNNGSNRNIFIKDKSKMDETAVRRQLNDWIAHNFAYVGLELHYRDIAPKIICEEYLEGLADNIYDYNIYCFHGEPAYIWCIKGSHKPDCKASFYNKDWEIQPFSYFYPRDPVIAPRPEKLEEMLKYSRILSKDFQHVRVDWYNLPDGRVLFGEMSFSACSGLSFFEPEEYDAFFGSLIKGTI